MEEGKERSRARDKEVLQLVPAVQPYVTQRIRVAENLGIFPRNMFRSQDLIDDALLDAYDQDIFDRKQGQELKLSMLQLLSDRLGKLMEEEEWHRKSVSTKLILDEELKRLEENFSMDANQDLIMNEDLDDISYHLNDAAEIRLPYDDQETEVRVAFGLKEAAQERWQQRGSIRKMYYKLPLASSNVMDLYVLGKLSLAEIARVMQADLSDIKEIISFIRKSFRKNIEE